MGLEVPNNFQVPILGSLVNVVLCSLNPLEAFLNTVACRTKPFGTDRPAPNGIRHLALRETGS